MTTDGLHALVVKWRTPEWPALNQDQIRQAIREGARSDCAEELEAALAHARPEAVDAEFLLRLRGFFQEINCDDDGEEYLNLSSDAMDEIDERLATLTPERAP